MISLDKETERVTAEITTSDVLRIAYEVGMPVSSKEAARLLRDGALAHGTWKHMMEAGRQYIAESLENQRQNIWYEEIKGSPAEYPEEFDA